MSFRNKILVFILSFVIVFQFNVLDLYANPVLIPVIVEDYIEYVTSAAGVRYKNQEQKHTIAEGYYDNMSDMEKADLYQEAEGFAVSSKASNSTNEGYTINSGTDILYYLNKTAFAVLKEKFKERLNNFNDYILNKIANGSASLDLVNNSDLASLNAVIKQYNLPELTSFSGQPGVYGVAVNSSLGEYVNSNYFVFIGELSNAYTIVFIPNKSDNIPIVVRDDKYYFTVNDYFFSYSCSLIGSFWYSSLWGQAESFSIDDAYFFVKDLVLYTNKNVILPNNITYGPTLSDDVEQNATLTIDNEQLNLALKNAFSEAGKLKLNDELDAKADEADKVILLGPQVTEGGGYDYSLIDKLGTSFVPTTDFVDKAGQTYADPITTEVQKYDWLSKFFLKLADAFVPNEYLLKVELLGVQAAFDGKFNISDSLNLLSVFDSATGADLPDFYFPLFGKKYLVCSGDYILEFTKDFRVLLRAFLWFCLVLIDIDQVYFIIRGVRLIRPVGSIDDTGGSED